MRSTRRCYERTAVWLMRRRRPTGGRQGQARKLEDPVNGRTKIGAAELRRKRPAAGNGSRKSGAVVRDDVGAGFADVPRDEPTLITRGEARVV